MSIPFLRDAEPRYGEAVEVAPGIRRLLCRNPGPFTHTGTNTWIVGQGRVVVLDPGPEDAAHHDAILRAVAGQAVERILVSHTHRDHSPGAGALRRATGAPTAGFGPHLTPPERGGEGGDHDFLPDERLEDGAAVEAAGLRLRALHTPGHCGNHLCFALEGTAILFSADHVMSWSTTVVSPPDGDMADYMAGLARIAARDDRLLLPGHGPPLPDPAGFLAALAAHRLERDATVLAALAAAPGATAAALVAPVYGPTLAPGLEAAAARSLSAHLVWAERRGLARPEGEGWRAT